MEITDIEAKLGVQGINYDKIPSTPSGSDSRSIYIYKLIELREQYEKERINLLAKRKEIVQSIGRLEDERFQMLLYRRYILDEKWEQIADELGYEERYIYKLHGYALEELRRTLKDSDEE